ncbi:MAG: SUMF1/EgtB/PvdO family nonheme iron enzyme [Phycisphaerales bacterium]|jgi:formylglycine-generating enzyme required for sulfatase activity|nr:SUMF1/EgtB/PvdO family nonheme iron enzyme [Phycisphaerales bacterium]
MHTKAAIVVSACVLGSALTSPALAQDYDFDWATIDHPGNAPYTGQDQWGHVSGRGRVDYTYRISKVEVTTAQWMEFVNTYSTQSDDLKWFAFPDYWGATRDMNYHGPGQRWKLRSAAGSANWPVTGITWRESAQFCNWLTNDKRKTLDAIASGAYDTSTFGWNQDVGFTDQSAHSPGAKFWIPTLDEWLKAVHYDPAKDNGKGGWWRYPNTSDTAPIPGIPGVGETSAGYEPYSYSDGFEVPLGSYPNTLTPWGLLDATGGSSEWTESWYNTDATHHYDRFYDSAPAGNVSSSQLDGLANTGAFGPTQQIAWLGLRVASIPGPNAAILASMFVIITLRRCRHATE